MKRRVPWTLWTFLTADVLRLVVMTTTALVTLIAFAAAVKPLADGQIGPADALKFMGLATVPMLQFALPFAAGFAATLVYHRFASDNEATAAMAGGVPHRSLLMPAVICGVVLAAGLSILAEQVIPHFLRSMEKVVTRNVANVMVSSIERGQSVSVGDLDIHAKEVLRVGPDESIGATERLRLSGVLAMQRDEKGGARTHVSAEQVLVWLFDDTSGGEPATAVQLKFIGASGRGPDDAMVQREFVTRRFRVPGAFTDDPKFLTWSQLRETRRLPEKHINKVESLRRRLADRVAEFRVLGVIGERLANPSGTVELVRGNERLTISHARLGDDGATLLPAPGMSMVRLDWRTPGGWTRAQECAGARLQATDDGAAAGVAPGEEPERGAAGGAAAWGPMLRLELERVVTLEAGGREPEGERAKLTYPGLRLAGGSGDDPSRLGTYQLLDEAARLSAAPAGAGESSSARGARLREAVETLRRMNDDLQREVTSKQHERMAFAAACFLMILTGAVVAMKLRDSLPLPVYLWSFFPALSAVITISSGQRLTHKSGDAGLILLWGGVAALAAFTLIEFRRLRRH